MTAITQDKAIFSIPSDIPERSQYRLRRAVEALKSFTPTEDPFEIYQGNLKWIFVNAMMDLYRSLPKPNFLAGKQIAICTYVEPDGLGDYYHAVTDGDILNEHYPQCPTSCLFDFHEFEKYINILSIPKDRQMIFFDSKDKNLTREKVQFFADILSKSSLIIDAPFVEFELLNPYFSKSAIKNHADCFSADSIAPEKILSFQEYDGEASFDDPNRWPLGVAPFHAGIFFKPPPKETSLSSLKEISLKKFLFSNSNPTSDDIIRYEKEHRLHYGYTKFDDEDDKTFASAYLLTIAAANELFKETIDVILPMKDLQMESKEETKQFFRSLGISKISLFKKDGNEIQLVQEVKIAEKGKTLRIINPFSMDYDDCKLLAFLSKAPVGCTGDISLSEAISFFQVYAYQAVFHKGTLQPSFLKVLIEELNEGKSSYLSEYLNCFSKIGQLLTAFEDDEKISSEEENEKEEITVLEPKQKKMRFSETQIISELAVKAGRLLQNPKIHEEMKAFCDLLKRRYCFNEVLIDLVDRYFAQMQFTSLAATEEILFNNFLSRKITLEKARDYLKQEISSFRDNL